MNDKKPLLSEEKDELFFSNNEIDLDDMPLTKESEVKNDLKEDIEPNDNSKEDQTENIPALEEVKYSSIPLDTMNIKKEDIMPTEEVTPVVDNEPSLNEEIAPIAKPEPKADEPSKEIPMAQPEEEKVVEQVKEETKEEPIVSESSQAEIKEEPVETKQEAKVEQPEATPTEEKKDAKPDNKKVLIVTCVIGFIAIYLFGKTLYQFYIGFKYRDYDPNQTTETAKK